MAKGAEEIQNALNSLDNMIDTPGKYTVEEKIQIVSRVVRIIGWQVQGHYNDIGILNQAVNEIKKMIGAVEDGLTKMIKNVDSKLFGSIDGPGEIYEMKEHMKAIHKSFDRVIATLWQFGIAIVIAVSIDILLRYFNVI